jgi:hypothetical protein
VTSTTEALRPSPNPLRLEENEKNQPRKHATLILYGRGLLAGIDQHEQKKSAAVALHKDILGVRP